jgi:Mg-chelatase subunit ChlD
MKQVQVLIIAVLTVFFFAGKFATRAVAQNLDVVLLMDASASMRLSDPKRLRVSGAELLVELLKPGDRLSIIEFSAEAKVLWDLKDFSSDQISNIKELLTKKLSDRGIYTDILAPLDLAHKMLTDKKNQVDLTRKAEKVLVLLSDGKMDPDPKMAASAVRLEQLAKVTLPALRKAEIKVYTVSFSDEADKKLLSDISRDTLGSSWHTPSAEKLHESFAKLVLAIKKPEFLETSEKSFRIDADIDEATFYISRGSDKEIEIKSPNGERYSKNEITALMRWHSSKEFDVLTILQPESGKWIVEGLPGYDGYATVLTELSLATTWPTSIIAGETRLLEARLFDDTKPVILPKMTDIIRYDYQIRPTDKISEPVAIGQLKDDGKDGDAQANDGIFTREIHLDEAGDYLLNIVAIGPTFERHQRLSFKVKPRLISLETVAEADSVMGSNKAQPVEILDAENDYFQVRLSKELFGFKDLAVELLAIDQQEVQYKLPLVRLDQLYEVPVKMLPHEGEYKIFATVNNGIRNKKKIRGQSEIVTYMRMSKRKDGGAQVVTIQDPEALKPKVEPKKEPFLLYLAAVMIVNIGVGSFGCKLINKVEIKANTSKAKSSDFTAYDRALAELDKRSQARDIALENPLIVDTKLNLLTIEDLLDGLDQNNIGQLVATEVQENNNDVGANDLAEHDLDSKETDLKNDNNQQEAQPENSEAPEPEEEA